jgi:hypothetical protein
MSDSEMFIKSFLKSTEAERQEQLHQLKSKAISDIISEQSSKNVDCTIILWQAACGIRDNKKLLKIVREVLPKLNRDTLSMRQYQDFINRFLVEVHNRSCLKFVSSLSQFCSECLRIGDQRAPFYKDILPVCLKTLHKKGESKVLDTEDEDGDDDGDTISAKEVANNIINEILQSDFALSTLTTMVSMFK